MDQRTTEGIARAESAQDIDGHRRHRPAVIRCGEQDAFAALLHDGQSHTLGQESISSAIGIGLAHRHLALGAIADDHRGSTYGGEGHRVCGIKVGPHAGTEVEVEDDLRATLTQVKPVLAGVGRAALREGTETDPQHGALANDSGRHVVRGELGVRCCCAPVEDDRRVLGWIQCGENDGGEALAGPDECGVDPPVA